MKLSKNFSLAEMTTTSTGLPNEPTEREVSKLRLFCEEVLQPIRDEVGALRVNSGYRSEAVNTAVGGSKTSQHRLAQAADVTPLSMPRIDVFLHIQHMWDSGELPQLDQCIIYETTGHLHLGSKLGDGNRGQFLVKLASKVDGRSYITYEKWLTLGREPLK